MSTVSNQPTQASRLAILVQHIRQQWLVEGDTRTAMLLAQRVIVKQFQQGQVILHQADPSCDLYLILSGRVIIMSDGRGVASRTAGMHVGEVALADPTIRRTASIIAEENCIVAVISEAHFSEVAKQCPNLWRAVAKDLAYRCVSPVANSNLNSVNSVRPSELSANLPTRAPLNFSENDSPAAQNTSSFGKNANSTVPSAAYLLGDSQFQQFTLMDD